jgi:F0F1-type ATP synthase membrane subunit a
MGSRTLSFLIRGFLVIALFNLFSLICYSFPITTILGLNITFGLSLWLGCLFFILTKRALVRRILPLNSPNGLAPFLSIVELVRILVRPITLSFRLLANIRAGHVLLTLACKMSGV